MTRSRVEDWIRGVEASRPGLRSANPGLWTNTLALCCYNEDKTVGQKRTQTGPISIDTIGIVSSPVTGNPGDARQIAFTGIDLMNAAAPGSPNELHWDDLGLITNQVFVVPNLVDISGILPISSGTNPQPGTVPYHPYDGDDKWKPVGDVLLFDYSRRPQLLDAMSVVWTARTIHDCYMEKLTLQQSIDKHRSEWCAALGVPVVPFP